MAQLPAKQDQYVKYAEKDSKGRNIAKQIDNTPSIVKDMVEGGTLDNAKPVYWHGLEMYQASNKGVVYAHILNNDNTPITLSSLIALMNSTKPQSFYLDAHGVVDIEGVQYEVIQVYRYLNSNDIKFILKTANGYISSSAINLTEFFNGMNDNGINKIN